MQRDSSAQLMKSPDVQSTGLAVLLPALLVDLGLLLSMVCEQRFAGGEGFAYGFLWLVAGSFWVALALWLSSTQKTVLLSLICAISIGILPLIGTIFLGSVGGGSLLILFLPLAVATLAISVAAWTLTLLPNRVRRALSWAGLALFSLAAIGTIVSEVVY